MGSRASPRSGAGMAFLIPFLVLVYGGLGALAHSRGLLGTRSVDVLCALPCWLVAGWYATSVLKGGASLLQQWAWFLMAVGWLLIGLTFLATGTTWMAMSLAAAAVALGSGFVTGFLANLESEGPKGGSVR